MWRETAVVDRTRKSRTRVKLFVMVLVASLVAVGCGSRDAGEATSPVASTVVLHEDTQDITVWAPEGEGSWPVVYLIPGSGRGQDLAETAIRLANGGVVVFAPDYRRDDSMPKHEQDVECGYRYIRSIAPEYGGDLDQPVTFVGDSFGATWALGPGVGETHFGPGGAYDEVCFTGVARPDVVVAIAGCYYEYQGGAVFPILDLMIEHAATAKRDGDLVLLVGEEDQICEVWQSEDAAETLQAAGYDAEVVVIPGGDHGNVVFWTETDGEWVTVPDDPVGQLVVDTILEAIDAAEA